VSAAREDGALARTLVVWCPDWPVTAVGAHLDAAVAVVAGGLVRACTQSARQAGVRRGQRIRDAQRHCPDLAVYEDDPDAQGRCFEAVVAVVSRFCPLIEVVRPGVCALSARGPARYFGGESRLAALVREAVRAAGHRCGVGVADGVFTAGLAARDGADGVLVEPGGNAAYLAPAPVQVLGEVEMARLLVRLGVRTVGEFAALPVGDVTARFGVPGRAAHRLARGVAPRPLAPRAPGSDFSAEMEFDPPETGREPLVFVAKSLADQVHDQLAVSGLACMRLQVRVRLEGGGEQVRLWRHEGELSATAVAERVRWQLEAWLAPHPADEPSGAGVVSLRLAADQVVIAEGRQLALWGRGEASERVVRAAERVRALLGHDAVTRPVLGGGRGPGERVTRWPWGDARWSALPRPNSTKTDSTGPAPWPGQVPAPAPAVVHPRPAPALVTDEAGGPVRVNARCVVSARPVALAGGSPDPLAVTEWSGPWPAVEHWWDQARARRLARFQAVTEDGRAWLLLVEGGRWWIEAVYQ
jgi:protein ImuB